MDLLDAGSATVLRGQAHDAGPLAERAFGDRAQGVLDEVVSEFNARCSKAGLTVQE